MAPWDILALQELQSSTRSSVEAGLELMGLELVYFEHPGREDALGIAYSAKQFSLESCAERHFPPTDPKATSGLVDLRHKDTGIGLHCVVTHQRGGNKDQLADLFTFAGGMSEGPVLICGDFNEDFGQSFQPDRFVTLDRDASAGEPTVSRPAHKQDPDSNSSGKGKIDYIFARGCRKTNVFVERDDLSREAIRASHMPCEETGEWPSDHGIEALSVVIITRLPTQLASEL